jgi:hypothetical protein
MTRVVGGRTGACPGVQLRRPRPAEVPGAAVCLRRGWSGSEREQSRRWCTGRCVGMGRGLLRLSRDDSGEYERRPRCVGYPGKTAAPIGALTAACGGLARPMVRSLRGLRGCCAVVVVRHMGGMRRVGIGGAGRGRHRNGCHIHSALMPQLRRDDAQQHEHKRKGAERAAGKPVHDRILTSQCGAAKGRVQIARGIQLARVRWTSSVVAVGPGHGATRDLTDRPKRL